MRSTQVRHRSSGPRRARIQNLGKCIRGMCAVGVLMVGLVACGSVATKSTGGVASSAPAGYLDPVVLGAALQKGLTAQLNDPKSNIYNDPASSDYQPGENMGTIDCIPILPASNDQFTCLGYFNDTGHTQWSHKVQVTPDGSGYQTLS